MTTAEICCRECRSHLGVCRQRRDCWCHWEARTKDNWSGPPTYRDPTANRAIRNADRDRKKRQRKER